MPNELCYPACRVDESHKPELVQAQWVIQVLVMNPSCIAEHHSRPPPGRNGHSDLPIDEEVDHTDNDLGHNAAADPVTPKNQIARIQLVVGGDQTQHDVP